MNLLRQTDSRTPSVCISNYCLTCVNYMRQLQLKTLKTCAIFPNIMGLIKICLISVPILISLTAAQGTAVLSELVKSEVVKQMKIEGKAIRDEIMKDLRKIREKQAELSKDLDNTKGGIHIFAITTFHFVPKLRYKIKISLYCGKWRKDFKFMP